MRVPTLAAASLCRVFGDGGSASSSRPWPRDGRRSCGSGSGGSCCSRSSLGILVGVGLYGGSWLVDWIQGGRLSYSVFVGVVGVFAGALGVHSTLRQVVPPRRLVLTRDRFAEQVRRDDQWIAVVDIAWEDVRSITVPDVERGLIRFPGTVRYTVAPAGGAETTGQDGSLRLASGYGPSRPLADLLDATRNGLVR